MLEIRDKYSGDLISKVREISPVKAVDYIMSSGAGSIPEIIEAMESALTKNSADFSRSITAETGKPIKFSRFEVETCISVIRYAHSYCDSGGIYGNIPRLMLRKSIPLFYSAIFPWVENILLDTVTGILSSLLTGSVPVVFPPETAPLTAMKFAEKTGEVAGTGNFPAVITGLYSRAGLTKIISTSRIRRAYLFGPADRISRIFRLIGIPVEIVIHDNGSAAAMVSKDADLNAAFDYILNGAYFNWTANPDIRLLIVHPEISDYFVNQIKERISNAVPMNPSSEEAVLAPVSDLEDMDAFSRSVKQFQLSGGRKLFGCDILREKFVLPALFADDHYSFPGVPPFGIKALTVMESPTVSGSLEIINSLQDISAAAFFTSDLYLLPLLTEKTEKRDVFINFYTNSRMKVSDFGYPSSLYGRIAGKLCGKAVYTNYD